MPSLFHYTKLSVFLDLMVPSGTIRTNNLSSMNDPRESLPWSFGSVNLPYEEIFSGYYSDKTHIDCQFKFGQLLKDRLQIICFSGAKNEGWNNEMMWAHYGQGHEGVCLEFDEGMLIENIRAIGQSSEFILENVNYNTITEKDWIYWNINNNYEENMSLNIKRMHKEITLSKSHFWSKEDEKRLVFLNSSEFIFIPIKGALKSIHVGVKFDFKLIDILENIAVNLNANLFRLIYQKNKFERWLLKRGIEGSIKSELFDHKI